MSTKGAERGGARFVPLADADALEELFKLSHSQPVVLFKHSTTCPISAAAYQEMSRYGGDISLLVVQKARELSRAVETLTGVRHESPQALVLRNGEVVWNASHWRVKADEIARAVLDHE